MIAFAKDTKVSTGQTIGEIISLLNDKGASAIAPIMSDDKFAIAFELHSRRFRISRTFRPLTDFKSTTTGRRRSPESMKKAHQQYMRSAYRGILLLLRGKLEAIESGMEDTEVALFPYIVLPNGQTFEEWGKPQIAAAYSSGGMPPLLSGV